MLVVNAKVTSKGQITLPAEVREALCVKAGDWVVFVHEGDEIRVERAANWADTTFGAVKPPYEGSAPSIEELKDSAAEGWVSSAIGGIEDDA